MSGKYIVPLQYRSEQDLVSAARDGDDRAIEQLVISHPPIRSIITSLKRRLDPGNRAQDDLEGAARLAVLEALRAYEPELLKNDADYGSDPEYAAVENAARDAEVRRFVACLPVNQRTIVTEVFWNERTHGEVALRLGTSRPAVTRTLQRVYARGERDIPEIRLQLAA